MHANRKMRAMPPNHTHKILHSSAMYYKNLNVIHKSNKKVLKTVSKV